MEWFKFRMSWEEPLMMLSDDEIGRVMRAVLTYIGTEEEQKTGDRGDLVFCMIRQTLREDLSQYRQKAEKKELLREKRSAAGRKSGETRRARSTKKESVQHVFNDADTTEQVFSDVQVCSDLFGKNKEYKNTEYQNTETRYSEKEEETEGKGDDGGSSSVPPPAVTELPVIGIPLDNGKEHPVYRRDIEQYVSLYPDINVEQELRNMRGWCLANPTRRKTRKGVRTFINSWLKKSQQETALRQEVPENPFLAYARGEKTFGDLAL